jgi:hypothetical protein
MVNGTVKTEYLHDFCAGFFLVQSMCLFQDFETNLIAEYYSNLTLLDSLDQKTEIVKNDIDTIKTIIREVIGRGERVMIYTPFVHKGDKSIAVLSEALTEEFDDKIGYFTGDEKSVQVKDAYDFSKHEILLCSDAIKTGTDGLQKHFNNTILYKVHATLQSIDQLTGRTDRQGSPFTKKEGKSVRFYFIESEMGDDITRHNINARRNRLQELKTGISADMSDYAIDELPDDLQIEEVPDAIEVEYSESTGDTNLDSIWKGMQRNSPERNIKVASEITERVNTENKEFVNLTGVLEIASKFSKPYIGDSVIDLGCGDSNYKALIKPKHYTGVDVCKGADIQASMHDLPVEDSSFDTVILNNSLSLVNIHKREDAVNEIDRILTPGGYITGYNNTSHRLFKKGEYKKLFANFSLIKEEKKVLKGNSFLFFTYQKQ